MSKSIVTDNLEECIFCGRPREAIHHIYGGHGRKEISDREGFIVPLCHRCHNMSLFSVHLDPDHIKDIFLKKLCQKKYEEDHTREEFIKLTGKSYL